MRGQIEFKDTGYFSKIICDYLDDSIPNLYNNAPNLKGFEKQINEKKKVFEEQKRKQLHITLEKQYENLKTSSLTQKNISLLSHSNTFTITTGHQLNIFTGPLYFIYKIVTAINIAKELKTQFPNYTFVPIYWMATEDHDFEEINHFCYGHKKLVWNKDTSGAVGKINTEGLEKLYELLSKEIGNSTRANYIKKLFSDSYLTDKTLSEATRYLVNELFKSYGLVIVDADKPELKSLFKVHIKNDLLHQTCYEKVSKANKVLKSKDYKIQVNPREINLFYLTKNNRERIVLSDNTYSVNNTDIKWCKNDILDVVEQSPENFSPNVLMRPLYQETILPNICYIGGGGELAYWLQLKSFFKSSNVPFPILMLRQSALIISDEIYKKCTKLNLSFDELFLEKNTFINKQVRKMSNINIDFSEQEKALKSQFKALYLLAEKTDKSFLGAVKAQEKKQLNGLKHLEKRLLKAEKNILSDKITRCVDIKNILFPNESLQERFTNFSEIYMTYGDTFIPNLIKKMKPFNYKFLIL